MNWRAGVLTAILGTSVVATAWGQTRVVTGKVTDSLTNEVITSGQVSVQGTTIGGTIKDDGTFTLAVPARDVTIMLRSIGYKGQNVRVPVGQPSTQEVAGAEVDQDQADDVGPDQDRRTEERCQEARRAHLGGHRRRPGDEHERREHAAVHRPSVAPGSR